MADLSGYRPWTPNTYFEKGEYFQIAGKVYQVNEGVQTGRLFNPTHSAYTIFDQTDNIEDYKVWKPNTRYDRGELFQQAGVVYRVLDPFTSGRLFSLNSDFTIHDVQGIKRVANIVITDQHQLVVTYTDGTQYTGDVGSDSGGGSYNRRTETVIADQVGELSQPTTQPDYGTSITLTVNGIAFHSQAAEPAFGFPDGVLTWFPNVAGYNVDMFDTIVIEYSTPVVEE